LGIEVELAGLHQTQADVKVLDALGA
jgi:hypothetical protein